EVGGGLESVGKARVQRPAHDWRFVGEPGERNDRRGNDGRIGGADGDGELVTQIALLAEQIKSGQCKKVTAVGEIQRSLGDQENLHTLCVNAGLSALKEVV